MWITADHVSSLLYTSRRVRFQEPSEGQNAPEDQIAAVKQESIEFRQPSLRDHLERFGSKKLFDDLKEGSSQVCSFVFHAASH